MRINTVQTDAILALLKKSNRQIIDLKSADANCTLEVTIGAQSYLIEQTGKILRHEWIEVETNN